ncbi:substrate-binding domain-containing protein [Paenibacillus aceti]|uniref:Sugar ABC transporter substrate-binding protein n=1 Tax=Paenibacillus aceti TaxID=1820010 RepID=A0ABQ1W806_9BACL|nr:substrate-binding domain-containing protein [Paenibacillus aceti]GGG17393.1 sugar ABC transporter substrate-binding protein [Paenibacillus aceti]
MSNRRWLIGLIVLVVGLGYILSQFILSTMKINELVQQIGHSNAETAQVKYVVLISQELDNPFWREMEKGAEAAADRLGIKLGYIGPIRSNPAEQIRLLEKAITARPDAILVQGMADPGYDQLISAAADQGIPVLTVDADEPESRRLAYVGTDNRAAGEQLGRLVLQDASSNGRIGVIIGSELADNQRLRLEGFRSIIAASPDHEIVDIRSSNISHIGAAQQTKDMLSQDGDIGMIVGFSSLDAGGIVEGIKAAHKEGVRVYGFDDLEITRQGIARGEIIASIVQQPREIGAKSIEWLSSFFNGEKLSDRYYIPTYILEQEASAVGGVRP